MPNVHSKPKNDDVAARRDERAQAILRSFFLGVTNYVLLLPAELQLTSTILKGDLAGTARVLAITGGMSGLIEFLLNPTFGKVSDNIGRRPFFLIGPAYVFVGNAILAATSDALSPGVGLALVVCNSFLRKVSGTVSGSVASVTALNDISSGRDFAIYMSKLWAYAGAGVVCAPFLSGYIESVWGVRSVYLAASLGGLVQLVHNYALIQETLEKRGENASKERVRGGWRDMIVNPLRCFQILTSNGALLRTAALACVFASFVEGKNMSTTNALYLRNQCSLSPLTASRHTVLYGIAMYLSGKYWVPLLLRRWGPRRFTTLANVLTALAFIVQARARSSRGLILSLLLLFTGINANSASAMKAVATDAAAKRGYGRGLFNGHFSNLRALVTTFAPLIYGGIYARAVRKGRHPGAYVYGAALVLGCALPEVLHRYLSDGEMDWRRKEKRV